MNALASMRNRASAIVGMALLFGAVGLGVKSTFAQDANSDAVSPDALPINVQGSWTGSITDDTMGAGDFTIAIMQRKRRLSGGWTATFPSTPEFLGDFEGRATAAVITLRLSSADFTRRRCRLDFRSITASGTEMQGNYRWVNCGKEFQGDKGGSIDITPTP